MSDYKGIFIWDRVTIVMRPALLWDNAYKELETKIPQGYPVETGNAKTLETAKNWAPKGEKDTI